MRGRGDATPFQTSEACLLPGVNLLMLWCGLRMWTRSADWQPCATTKVFQSSHLAPALVLKGESVLCRYSGVSWVQSHYTKHIYGYLHLSSESSGMTARGLSHRMGFQGLLLT